MNTNHGNWKDIYNFSCPEVSLIQTQIFWARWRDKSLATWDKSQHGSSQGKDFIRPPYTGQSTVGSSVESIVPTGLSSRACEHPRNGVSTRLFMTIYLRKQRQRYSTHLNSVRGHHYPHLQMWELDYKESWALKNWCFWTVVLEKTLESPLDCKEIQPVHPKGNQSWMFIRRTDTEAETPILWPPDAKNWFTGKNPDAGKDWRQEEKGTTEDEMVGWHHWLDGHEFEQAPGVSDGQGSLASYSPRGRKESDTTERLNWTDRWRN